MNHRLSILRARAFFFTAVALLALPVLSTVSRATPTTIVSYLGTDYTVTVDLDTTYSAFFALHGDQVWTGDSAAAAYFAHQVTTSLGTNNFNVESPFFVISANTGWTGDFWNSSDIGGDTLQAPYSDVYQYTNLALGFGGAYAYVESSSPVTPDSVPDAGATSGYMLIALTTLGVARRRIKSLVA
jgi:hypothetical protein